MPGLGCYGGVGFGSESLDITGSMCCGFTRVQVTCIKDVITYNAAMSGCARAGFWELALGLLGAMRLAAVAPDAATYTVLLEHVPDARTN